MAKIPIYDTKEKEMRAWLAHQEWEAHQENSLYDIKKSLRSRTMTKKLYSRFKHGLRLFFWRIKQNKLGQYVQ